MTMAGAEAAYVPEEPSPWWLKGLAIFMALLTVYMLFAVAMGILSPMLANRLMPDDYSEIEPYPEDGTDEDKAEWNETDEFWDDMVEYTDEMMGVMEFSALYSGLLVIIGLFCIPVLWRGDRELGIKLVGAWIGVNLLGGMGIMWMMSRIGFMPDFDYGPEAEAVDFELIETLSMVGGYAQIILCNVCFLGILALAASKSKPATSFDIPSGFRPDEPSQP